MRADAFVELRLYLKALRRRWPFVVIPTLIVLIVAAVTFERPSPTYQATVQYIVSQEPTESADLDEEARQFTWIVSQYVVNAVTDWVNATEFAALVAAEIGRPDEIDTGTVAAAIEADTFRSILEVSIAHPDSETVEQIGHAIAVVLNEQVTEAVPQLGDAPALIDPIDEVIVVPVGPGASAYLDVPLRIFVAIAAGFGAALLVEYLDPKIYGADQVALIDIPLIAEIPAAGDE